MQSSADVHSKLTELRVSIQMLESVTDADRSVVQGYAIRALHLMTDLLTCLGSDHTWGSVPGTPWPEVTPVEELAAAARWALQHWYKEPALAITVQRQQGVAPAAYWRELPRTDDGPQESFTPRRAYQTDLAGSPILDLLHEVYPLLVHRLHHLDEGPRRETPN